MGINHSVEAADPSREVLHETDLQQVNGGLKRGDLFWIRELACRQGVPFDVLQNGAFGSILDRTIARR